MGGPEGATAGLSSSEGKFSRESTAGQASSGTLWALCLSASVWTSLDTRGPSIFDHERPLYHAAGHSSSASPPLLACISRAKCGQFRPGSTHPATFSQRNQCRRPGFHILSSPLDKDYPKWVAGGYPKTPAESGRGRELRLD